ncbi:MAG: F0F1 ATP synthase subunit epsilon [Acidobacteria bacterium]|nr:F0F1 ATP synthase subunit epsilon [Acidobacteriota bacterium]
MAATIELEVATPERELVREQVSEVEIPGRNGYLGVLPGHAPLVGLLGIGTLSFVAGGVKRYFAVHSGFVEVADDHVRVLANVAEAREEIDVHRARNAYQRAIEASINPSLGLDPAAALDAMMRAQARIATAEKQ